MNITGKERDAIVAKFAKGKVLFEYRYCNEGYSLYTERQGGLLIRDGVNILEPYQDGMVIDCFPFDNGDFDFETEKQGFVLIRDGVNILKPHQEGKAIDSYSYPNGDFEFETKEQGVVLIRNGENILAPHQDGKASGVYSNDNGDFMFYTEKQGEVYITKSEHEAKIAAYCLRCQTHIGYQEKCHECGNEWDTSADTLPTPAQLRRWVQLYSVNPARAEEIEEGLDICFAQAMRGVADVIEERA